MKLRQAHKFATELEEIINSELLVDTTIHIDKEDIITNQQEKKEE